MGQCLEQEMSVPLIFNMKKFFIIGGFFILVIILPRMEACVMNNGGEDIPIIRGAVEE